MKEPLKIDIGLENVKKALNHAKNLIATLGNTLTDYQREEITAHFLKLSTGMIFLMQQIDEIIFSLKKSNPSNL